MQNSIRKDDLIVEQDKATNLRKVRVAQCLGEGEDRKCGQSRYNIVLRGVRILWPAAISATKDQPLGLRIGPGYLSRRVVEIAGIK